MKHNPDFWKHPITVILCTLVLFFAAQIIGAFMAAPFVKLLPRENLQLLAYIGMNLLALIGLLVAAQRLLSFSWPAIGLKKPSAKALLLVLPAFALYFVASTGFTLLATKFIPGFNVEQAQEVGFSNLAQPSELLAGFLSLVILTPLFEELIFRGVLFRGLRRRLPFWFSAIAASVLFAIAHMQWNVAVDTFALSLLLCYLAERSGSIVPSIALHALKNSLAFVLLFIVKV